MVNVGPSRRSGEWIDWDRFHSDASYRDGVTDLGNLVMAGIPESWDGDGSQESLLIEYLETIERRLVERGGTLERWPEE